MWKALLLAQTAIRASQHMCDNIRSFGIVTAVSMPKPCLSYDGRNDKAVKIILGPWLQTVSSSCTRNGGKHPM